MLSRHLPLTVLMLAALGVGCKAREPRPAPKVSQYDGGRQRRVIDPPPGELRPVAPHAIEARGIGPYQLGASLKETLGLLPHGPRVILMELAGIADYSLVMAEQDALIIGVERPAGVSFLSVLDEATAKTESGVGVGTDVTTLAAEMGPRLRTRGRAADPRLWRFARLPNARFVVQDDHVSAVVLREVDEEATPGEAECGASEALGAWAGPIRASAELAAQDAQLAFGCFTGLGPEAAVWSGDRIAIVGGEAPGRLREVAAVAVSDVAYAAAIDVDGDNRDELAVVSAVTQRDERIVRVAVFRIDAGRAMSLASADAYRVSAANAAWSGAKLDGIDFLIELESRDGDLQVGGLWRHRAAGKPPVVVPLVPTEMSVRRKPRATEVRPAPPPAVERDAQTAPPLLPDTEAAPAPSLPAKSRVPGRGASGSSPAGRPTPQSTEAPADPEQGDEP